VLDTSRAENAAENLQKHKEKLTKAPTWLLASLSTLETFA
jgi:hypothetical protein